MAVGSLAAPQPVVIIGWPGAAAIAAVALAFVVWRLVRNKAFGSMTARLGPASLDLRGIEKRLDSQDEVLDSIDHAVNNVKPGEVTLRERVEAHTGQIAAIRDDVTRVCKTVDCGFQDLNERLDQMAEAAARHHPEDSEEP